MKSLISFISLIFVVTALTNCSAEQKMAFKKSWRAGNSDGFYNSGGQGGYYNTYNSKGVKSGSIYVPYSSKGGYYNTYDSKGSKSGSIYVPYSESGGYYKTSDKKGKKKGSIYIPDLTPLLLYVL